MATWMPRPRNEDNVALVDRGSSISVLSVTSRPRLAAGRPCVGEHLFDEFGETGIAQLTRRDVHPHDDVVPMVAFGSPVDELEAGPFENEFSDGNDLPGFLGGGNELQRRNLPVGRRIPSQQRFHRGDLSGRDIDHGLKSTVELSFGESHAEICFDHEPGRSLLAEILGEYGDRIPPGTLGRVHRQVRVTDQVGRTGITDQVGRTGGHARRVHCDTDTGRQGNSVPVDGQRLLQHLDDLSAQRFGAVQAVDARAQQQEFVAAETGNGGCRSGAAGEPGRHRLQESVAGGMTEGVVHELQLIQVHEQHRESTVGCSDGDL